MIKLDTGQTPCIFLKYFNKTVDNDGIRGVLSYMKLVKNAGVTLPDYYIVTNGVKEQVAKIHF